MASPKKKTTLKTRRTGGPTDARLSSAPLAEVVFELKWDLQQGPFIPFDPMLIPLIGRFTAEMERAGYSHTQDFAHPQQTGAYGVVRRYFKNAETPFPILQIGSGIFATNESAQYEWKKFKTQILVGLKALFDSYPTHLGYSIRPNTLELRYVDVFDKTVLGNAAFFHFTETGTSLNFKLPKILDDKEMFWGDASGRFFFQRSLRGRKDTVFVVDLGSGQKSDTKETILQMASKVVSSSSGVPAVKTPRNFIAQVGQWLEFAHGVTSPFFKTFILPDVMKKFRGNAKV